MRRISILLESATSALLLKAGLSIVATIVLSACNREPGPVAGGWTDTETGTKVSGLIRKSDGAPAAGALISLRPSDYLARNPAQPDSTAPRIRGSVLDAVCDSAGRFWLDSVDMGDYVLEARLGDTLGLLVRFTRGDDAEYTSLAPAALQPMGRMKGRIAFSDGAPGPALVRIFGMERAIIADPLTGTFAFLALPAGAYTLHASGLEPFILPVDKDDIPVSSGSTTDAGEVILERRLKQAFKVMDGLLDLPGVDSTNPLIFENGVFRNPVDGAYLWAKASMGHLDLRGTLVSYGGETGDAAREMNLGNCRRMVARARASGMRKVMDPVAGARHKLVPSASGRIEDIVPDPTPGGLLLIQEAYRARPEKPLIVISGASLTTVAEALLRDPAIANRMIVIGANNGNVNNSDSLAALVVAKKARLVEWARNYYWDNRGLERRPADAFQSNALGLALRRQINLDTVSPYWAASLFGDFGAATYLFNRKVWRNAEAANFTRPTLPVEWPAPAPFDFVDIPKGANDWAAIHDEFYSTLNNPAAYHPWPLSDSLDASAFSASLRVSEDPAAANPAPGAVWTDQGSWAEYSVVVDFPGLHVLEAQYRAGAEAELRITDSATGSRTSLPLPPTPGGTTGKVPMLLKAGPTRLRIESTRSTFALDWISIRTAKGAVLGPQSPVAIGPGPERSGRTPRSRR